MIRSATPTTASRIDRPNQFHFQPAYKDFRLCVGSSQADVMSPVTIDLDDDLDRWQWTCPAGHRSWEPTNHHFWCPDCARDSWDDGIEPEFDELRNVKTDELVAREDVRLETEMGAYQDLVGGSA